MSAQETVEDELLALAHQLKNCLLVVQGSVGLIQARPGDVKQVLELSADMSQASQRACELVSDLQSIVLRRRAKADQLLRETQHG